MAYNADDPKQVKKAKKQAEFDEALKLEVVRSLMSTAPGRNWVYGLLDRCHCFSTSFIQGYPDATAFQEGERNIGLQLLADVQGSSPESYLDMIREAKNASS